MRKKLIGWAAGLAVLWVCNVLAISLSPSLQGSVPYFGGFGSETMWVAAAIAAVIFLLPAALYGAGQQWAKYVLAVINGVVMIVSIVLFGLMVVMLLFRIGGEGWYVMAFDPWFFVVALLCLASVGLGYGWFRAAFPLRGDK